MPISRKYFVTVHFLKEETGPVEMVENLIFWGSTYKEKSEQYEKALAAVKARMEGKYKYMVVSPPVEAASWMMDTRPEKGLTEI